jgi:hypothetical protein
MGQCQHAESLQRESPEVPRSLARILLLIRPKTVSRQPNTGAQTLLRGQPRFNFAESPRRGRPFRILGKHPDRISPSAITNGFASKNWHKVFASYGRAPLGCEYDVFPDGRLIHRAGPWVAAVLHRG